MVKMMASSKTGLLPKNHPLYVPIPLIILLVLVALALIAIFVAIPSTRYTILQRIPQNLRPSVLYQNQQESPYQYQKAPGGQYQAPRTSY